MSEDIGKLKCHCMNCGKWYMVEWMDDKCPFCGYHQDHSEGLNLRDDIKEMKAAKKQ